MTTMIGSRFYPEMAAGGFSRCDGTVLFYQRIRALAGPQSVVLDFGAGRGAGQTDDAVAYRRRLVTLKGAVREVIGVDPDPAVETNPGLDRAIVIGSDGRLTLPDRSVDVVVSDFTFEHIADPAGAARELDRVLVPGGWLCVRTPNRHGYIALANRLVPARGRAAVLRGAQADRKEQDVFPAVYRFNTAAALEAHFPPQRYDHHLIYMDGEPAYHFGSPLLYGLFMRLHALTPDRLKTTIQAFLQKRQ